MDNLRTAVRAAINEMYGRPYGVAYTGAIVENEADIRKLNVTMAEEMVKMRSSSGIGSKWVYWQTPSNYHMTICLGELPLHLKMRGDVGKEVTLHVTHIGVNKGAVAFRVTGYMSKNDVQHITMRFLSQPSDSKNIHFWHPLEHPFDVSATIREVAAQRP